jgi:putative FmdB family regulatory protein
MPTYTYYCEDCQTNFEVICSLGSYQEKAKCKVCGKKKNTHREYSIDLSTLNASVKKSDNELKTIGDLAKRNSDRMSDDQKEALRKKHNEYKDNKPDDPLPSGMSRIEKPTKSEW